MNANHHPWILTSRLPANPAPTFLGNGYFAARIPSAGTGFAANPAPTDSQVAGFFARTPGYAEQRADIPTWSTLTLGDGSGTYGPLPGQMSTAQWQGGVRQYRQQLDLRRGLLTTDAVWTSPAGNVTRLHYLVFVDRARPHVAVVQLRFTPTWTGSATLTDALDGRDTQLHASGNSAGAIGSAVIGGVLEGTDNELTRQGSVGRDAARSQIYESVTALGTGAVAAEASTLRVPSGGTTALAPSVSTAPESVGQQATLQVQSGRTYTVTKFVAVDTSHEDTDPLAGAQRQSVRAAAVGVRRLLAEHVSAWNGLWRSDIEVRGDPRLQQMVRASMFYLLTSVRATSPWSISPAGLSSAGYNGHVFWDAETWMYPPLLALHPQLAAAMNRYRDTRLGAAEQYAQQSGYVGARFPWESALKGDEQTPGFANTPIPVPPLPDTGHYEQHITADVALAQWQYFLATGNRQWLRRSGWPVLREAARFWAGRAVAGAQGTYHINNVMGPDENRANVNDSSYTNVAAARTLQFATAAATEVGARAPRLWRTIAAGLIAAAPYDRHLGVYREDASYHGETVKQGDVIMLQYPWHLSMPRRVALRDVAYYAPRTNPTGPSMTDAVNAADLALSGASGCADYFYLRRSIDPFARGPFEQFSETRVGGAFTFLTGAGGFLQEFVYAFPGLRFGRHAVALAPTLPPQLHGITLRRLHWQGRVFTVNVGTATTGIQLLRGNTLPVVIGGHRYDVRRGRSVTVPTSRPGRRTASDIARCRPVQASSADASYPAVGAVDGDMNTAWHATAESAVLRLDLGRGDPSQRRVRIVWGGSRATKYVVRWSPGGRYLTLRIRATTTGAGAVIKEVIVSRR